MKKKAPQTRGKQRLKRNADRRKIRHARGKPRNRRRR